MILVASVLILAVIVIAWKHGIRGGSRSLIQGLLVLFAATVASGTYFTWKARIECEPSFTEKFWMVLPLLASLVVTERCIFARLIRLVVRRERIANTTRRKAEK